MNSSSSIHKFDDQSFSNQNAIITRRPHSQQQPNRQSGRSQQIVQHHQQRRRMNSGDRQRKLTKSLLRNRSTSSSRPNIKPINNKQQHQKSSRKNHRTNVHFHHLITFLLTIYYHFPNRISFLVYFHNFVFIHFFVSISTFPIS